MHPTTYYNEEYTGFSFPILPLCIKRHICKFSVLELYPRASSTVTSRTFFMFVLVKSHTMNIHRKESYIFNIVAKDLSPRIHGVSGHLLSTGNYGFRSFISNTSIKSRPKFCLSLTHPPRCVSDISRKKR